MKLNWLSIGLLAALSRDAGALQIKREVPRDQLQYGVHYFDQKVNHFPDNELFSKSNLSRGTFKQRYYFDSSYYKPGGPVYLYISGETSGPSRFSNLQTGIIQILMQATNGLGVILENRYYGASYPFKTSTTDELLFLTTNQTIADNAHFAQNAVFPGVNGSLTAPNTPWIVYGGSLAGAQTAASIKVYGDILYGGIASSAPIKVSVGYPEWYNPIQKYAPQDCVTRINQIVDNFDLLVAKNHTKAIKQFKALFGLESLTDHRDFASAIADPIGNPGFYHSNTWQELNWNSTYGSRDFFYFCGNVSDIDAPEEITQVDNILANYTNGEPWTGLGNYANYVKRYTLPLCPSGDYNSNDCWGTQNASAWASIENTSTRSYLYTSCIEQGAYIAAPKEGPALLSRVVDTDYEQQWCRWAFAPGKYNSIPSTPDVDAYNDFGAFNFTADRLAFIDGDQDVWNDLCYHSNFAPARTSSDLHPELLITGAGHHWDSYGILDVEAEPQFIREAHKWEIKTVKKWLGDFDDWRQSKKSCIG
ncbi:peptidase S28 [Daldinia decipiens]|uniref:peptidase S28 n=1 Tax=Daldinia decipiens TaxID=326647 RepID=UPI0020C240E8|nr:peptidase S28 [Daldinia decipiens]KAI1661656.1 peptidase S28 [Daldinia decipiens]